MECIVLYFSYPDIIKDDFFQVSQATESVTSDVVDVASIEEDAPDVGQVAH